MEGLSIGIISVLFLIFVYRYSYKINFRASRVVYKLLYVEDVLNASEDPERAEIDMDKYLVPFTMKADTNMAITELYLKNKVYNSLVKELTELQRCKKKFWKKEGLIYIVIFIVSLVLMQF